MSKHGVMLDLLAKVKCHGDQVVFLKAIESRPKITGCHFHYLPSNRESHNTNTRYFNRERWVDRMTKHEPRIVKGRLVADSGF